jgi:orotidine-5'-phosphate decarboxylase
MDVMQKVQAANGTALINVSRSVLYASSGDDCIKQR